MRLPVLQKAVDRARRIHWHELQTYYAHGSVVQVGAGQNLVEVAVQLGLDNSAQFEQWIADGEVSPVSDEQALAWYNDDAVLWAVVAAPARGLDMTAATERIGTLLRGSKPRGGAA